LNRGLFAGAVVGFVGGLSGVLFGGLGNFLGLYGTPPISVMEWTVYWIVITTVLGAIFGLIYARVFDSIPGKGILKGVYAGLGIWLIKDIATGIYLGFEQARVSVVAIIWVGFFIWLAYGLVMGKLYKK
jgi:ABC-type sugar transport system permease subunit